MKEKRGQYPDQEDRLLKYVKGQLSQPEREEMEAALESSPALQKEARFIKNLNEVVEDPGWAKSAEALMALKKEKLAALHGTTTTNKPLFSRLPKLMRRNKPFLFFLFLTIAMVILLTGNFFILADCSQLYEKYLTAYEDIMTPGAGARPELLAGIAAYKKGKREQDQYAIAMKKFDQIKDKDPLFRFYTAVSRMLSPSVDVQQSKAELAILRKEIEEDEDGNYTNFLAWIDYYEALLAFKEEEFKSGKAQIKELATKSDLDYELQQVVKAFNRHLRFLYMAR